MRGNRDVAELVLVNLLDLIDTLPAGVRSSYALVLFVKTKHPRHFEA